MVGCAGRPRGDVISVVNANEARLRVEVLIDHPAQHFSEGLALLATASDLDTEVLYWTTNESGYRDDAFGRDIVWDVGLTAGYPFWVPEVGPRVTMLRSALGRLRERRPDVILCYGWSTPVARLGVIYAALFRVPLLFYGDSTWQHSGRPHLRRVRTFLLRRLFTSRRTGALTTGTFNREFYLLHGMTPDRAHPGVCPVVTHPFVRAYAMAAGQDAQDDRELTISFAGKFIERKAAADLLHAAARLPPGTPYRLSLIGDGPLRESLEVLVDDLGLRPRTTFEGFKNTSEMPAALAATDVLVIPSTRDMRVLVATEAMAASAIPVVSSATAVWGAGDLVEHGVTGLVFPVGDVDKLAECLLTLIVDRDVRDTLASAARRRALEHDSDDYARLAARALRAAARHGLEDWV